MLAECHTEEGEISPLCLFRDFSHPSDGLVSEYNSLMRVNEFYQSRRSDWETLSGLLDQSQKEVSRLSETQVRDLARLYRAATSDLALAQRDFPRNEVTI